MNGGKDLVTSMTLGLRIAGLFGSVSGASINMHSPHVAVQRVYITFASCAFAPLRSTQHPPAGCSLQKQHSISSKILMLTVFLLVFLCRRYGTSAAPIIDPGPPIHGVPIFARDDTTDANAGRSVWDILWSCLATTFAVTWVSVHPNVPFLEETSWIVLKRRIFLMVLALLAPEVMIMWAFKQWRGAVMIKEIINKARPESCMSYILWNR